MTRRQILNMVAAGVLCLGSAACQSSTPAETFEAGPQARRYPLSGTVRAVEHETRTVSVAHGDITDLMEAMTMSFAVKDAWVLDAAGANDRISATLVVDGARSWLEGVALTKADRNATPGEPPVGGAGTGVGPAPGTALPAAPLVDQDGRTVDARSFDDRVAIYTFIYTRCPLPDYCPLMMSRLNDVAARLRAAGRRDEVQLVAITLDPAYDTPDVLAAFGRRTIKGEGDAPFHRWSLLTGDAGAIGAWASLFDLTYASEGGEIVHGLRTVVADEQARVVGVLRGNDYTTDQLMALLRGMTE